MDGHIYIYGEIAGYQGDDTESYGLNSLKSIKKQVDKQPKAKNFVVHIHSVGGEVYEGFAIHDYLRSLGVPITTRIEGLCASIATVIALAGDTRLITSNSDFMIHNPWGYAGGEKKDIQKYADELERIENKLSDFYESKTKLSKKKAQKMMDTETWLSSEETLKLGFVTEVVTVLKAVAKFKKPSPQKDSKKATKMAKEKKSGSSLSKKDKSWIENQMASLKNLINPAKNLIVLDANGVSIDFVDVEDGEDIAVGDMATVEGEDAQGDYVMPSGETYVFESGELKDIKPSESEGNDEEVEALTLENKKLKKELKAEKKSRKKMEKRFNKQMDSFKEDLTNKFDLDDKDDAPQNKRKSSKSKTKTRSLLKASK